MNAPPKRKAPAPTKVHGALQDSQPQADSSFAGDTAQGADVDPFARFRAVWAADVSPASRKLVLLSLADFANPDGTSIRPAIASIAKRCGISSNHARNHVHALLDLGAITQTHPANQRRAATYALNFDTLYGLTGERESSQGSSGRASRFSRAPAGECITPPLGLQPASVRAPAGERQGSSGLETTKGRPGGRPAGGLSGSGFAGPGGRGKTVIGNAGLARVKSAGETSMSKQARQLLEGLDA